MPVDGVAAIHQRIAQIQAHIASLQPQHALRTVGGGTAAADFGAVLAAAQTEGARSSSSGASSSGAVGAVGAVGAGPGAGPGAAGAAAGAGGVPGSGRALVDGSNVPYELAGYGNGRVPADALSPIAGSSHRLWAPAARSFEAMRDAAARDGMTIGITDSYRSYDSQVDLAARKGLYSQGGLAAVPGTSNHGWGMALDLDLDAGALAWLREHGGEYGFVEAVPRESWHWEYHPTR